MMLTNNNQTVIKNLARASLKHNRRRYLVIFLAILLSAFMLFSVLTVGVTYFKMWKIQNLCSCSKFLSQILKIVDKNFSEIVPGKQTQKEGFRPLIFLTHSMRITLLIIIEFNPCIYAVKFNFIPFQVPLYQAADVIQNRT